MQWGNFLKVFRTWFVFVFVLFVFVFVFVISISVWCIAAPIASLAPPAPPPDVSLIRFIASIH